MVRGADLPSCSETCHPSYFVTQVGCIEIERQLHEYPYFTLVWRALNADFCRCRSYLYFLYHLTVKAASSRGWQLCIVTRATGFHNSKVSVRDTLFFLFWIKNTQNTLSKAQV